MKEQSQVATEAFWDELDKLIPSMEAGLEKHAADSPRRTLVLKLLGTYSDPKILRAEKEKKADAKWAPAHIHKIAKHFGISYESKEFMQLSKQVTGKEHLDSMTPTELRKLATALIRKYKTKEKRAFLSAVSKRLSAAMPKVVPPQVSSTKTMLRPIKPSVADIKVPGTVRANAGMAINVKDLKSIPAIYG